MWIYPVVFFAKLIEVTLSTLRNVLINRGEKLKGSFIGFFEITIWVILSANVLTSIAEDPLKAVVYCAAFSLGNFLGATIEAKLAIGMSCIQAIIDIEKEEDLCEALREKGFGVTIMTGNGKDGPVGVILVFLKRKRINEVSALIRCFSPRALITINDVRNVRNGYINQK